MIKSIKKNLFIQKMLIGQKHSRTRLFNHKCFFLIHTVVIILLLSSYIKIIKWFSSMCGWIKFVSLTPNEVDLEKTTKKHCYLWYYSTKHYWSIIVVLT